MASNNDRLLSQRKNGNNKKNKDNRAAVMQHLTEMFGTTFDSDIIVSVAELCKWKMESSVDALIQLSSTAQNSKPSRTDDPPAYDPWTADPYPFAEETQPIVDSASLGHHVDDKPSTEPKVETASLCGLKVEYRPKGMENISDDDADVVIEEESSDYRLGTPEPTQRSVNVCQFLETPTVQCPPRNTLTKVNYINTASPPLSPARSNVSNNNNSSLKIPANQAEIESNINNGYKVMILMRGCPGSGKSYLAREIVTRTCGQGSDFSNFIFSSDDYFAKINRGVYVFDASKLQDAHFYNQNRVFHAAKQGWSPIIVDNTNTQAWEMQYYMNVGVEHGYIIETLEPNTSWFRNAAELERRNRHCVPKSKIRVMLERYEPGLSGLKLFRVFKLIYNSNNQPPQMRKLPPLPRSESQEEQIAAILQPQTRKPKNPVEDMSQVCDALSSIAKEYSNLETVATPPTTISAGIEIVANDSSIKQSNNENWTEGSSYKEDCFLDLTKLGAIGSERQASNAIITNVISNQKEKTIADASKEEDNLITLEPINTEKRNSSSKMEEATSTDNGLSQCWDFTLLLDGVQIHSKLDEEIPKADKSILNIDDQQVLQKQNNELYDEQIIQVQGIEPAEESKIEDSLKEPQSPSDSSSSSISSLERVDMSQFEICNNPEAAAAAASSEIIGEKSSAGGIGSIFSFIKNSFLGNEKEKSPRRENFGKDKSTSTDNLTDKLRSSSEKDTSSTLSMITLNATVDTLSSKLSNSSNDIDKKNLKCEVQESSTIPVVESIIELSGESDEFFEARDSLPMKPNERVVEELLEASSDFQLVGQYDEFVTHMKGKDDTDGKFVSQKNFTEPIKNLQVLVKFEEEDSKVLKEPIDRVFGGKNVFTEKMQNTSGSNALTPKPNNSSSNALTENVNLINWRASPFPLDAESAVKLQSEVASKVETCDKETFTDAYDFNVAYVGGTDDYKVLEAFNRSINEPGRHSPDETPLHHKLMLHKGTMTSNTSVLLLGERLFELEIQPADEASNNDRGEELVTRYPHLPRACVLDVYDNCQRDFNWALDYLDNLQQDQPTVSAAVEQHIAEAEAEAAGLAIETQIKSTAVPIPLSIRTSESSSSSSLSSSPQRLRSNKKERIVTSDAQLALKRQFEDKFVLSEQSYKPYTLKVKRWKNRDFSAVEESVPNADEALTESSQRKPSRLDHPAVEEEEVDNEDEEEESMEDEPEETIELKLGYEFIRVLEKEFGSSGAGNDNFQPPDGLFPVIQIRKSMAQELHALWIESMERQLNFMHEQLDAMIAKDAEYARTLEQEEARGMYEPINAPNLKEIMDMEMALATFSNDRVSPYPSKRKHKKQKFKKESLREMTSRVTERTLHDMFPDYERDMLLEIYEAHDRDFSETVRVIQENCSSKSTITMADVLKKRKTLIDELQKESTYQTSKHNQLENEEGRDEASGGAYEDEDTGEELTYEEALQIAQDSRDEASRQRKHRNANYQKACEAYRGKNHEVAAYYADVAKLHLKRMEQANATAASAYLAAQAYAHENDDTLDLHHLRVEEALRALDIFLDHQLEVMNKGTRKNVFIITGRGARSINGQSRLKPAVANKLNQKSINFEQANPGMLKACLRKK